MDVSQDCYGQRIQGCECTEELLVVLGEPGPVLPAAELIIWSLPCCRCISLLLLKGNKANATPQSITLAASSFILE